MTDLDMLRASLQAATEERRGVNERTALYRLYDAAGTLLYVGITKNTGQRWFQHRHTKSWWHKVARREVAWFDSRPSALLAEHRAIVAERPLHNSPNDPQGLHPGTTHGRRREVKCELARELADAQAEFKRETERMRLRRQRAVMTARSAGWSKYRIAAVLGVKGPTVDSIIETAERQQS